MLKSSLATLALLSFTFTACSSSGDGFNSETVTAEIRSELTEHMDAVNAKNYALAAEIYSASPEFTWLEDGVLRYESSSDITDAFAQLSAATPTLKLENISIDVIHAQLAYVSYEFDQKLDFENGPLIEFNGVISAVMEKNGNDWQFLHGHTSTPKPRG